MYIRSLCVVPPTDMPSPQSPVLYRCAVTSVPLPGPQISGPRRCRSALCCSSFRPCSARPTRTTRWRTIWPSCGSVTRPRLSGTPATGPGCTLWAASEPAASVRTQRLATNWREVPAGSAAGEHLQGLPRPVWRPGHVLR